METIQQTGAKLVTRQTAAPPLTPLATDARTPPTGAGGRKWGGVTMGWGEDGKSLVLIAGVRGCS